MMSSPPLPPPPLSPSQMHFFSLYVNGHLKLFNELASEGKQLFVMHFEAIFILLKTH